MKDRQKKVNEKLLKFHSQSCESISTTPAAVAPASEAKSGSISEIQPGIFGQVARTRSWCTSRS